MSTNQRTKQNIKLYPLVTTFYHVKPDGIIEYETRSGEFFHKCLQAKISNKASYKLYIGKESEVFDMTPQEELHAQFFNDEAVLVSKMTDGELEQHREKLARIAFEARARLTAVNADKERRKKGIKANVVDDILHTDALNKIQKSVEKKKLSKEEKTIQSLMSLGMSKDEATKLIWSTRTDKQNLPPNDNGKIITSPLAADSTTETQTSDKHSLPSTQNTQQFKIDDPFAKKE